MSTRPAQSRESHATKNFSLPGSRRSKPDMTPYRKYRQTSPFPFASTCHVPPDSRKQTKPVSKPMSPAARESSGFKTRLSRSVTLFRTGFMVKAVLPFCGKIKKSGRGPDLSSPGCLASCHSSRSILLLSSHRTPCRFHVAEHV
jgi:hypothetical protein